MKTLNATRDTGLSYRSIVLSYCFLLVVAAGLLMAQPATAAEGVKGNLVSVEWLEKNRGNADVVLLDASFPHFYAAKHIPGATSAFLMTYAARERPAAAMQKLFQSWGISPGKKIVMYDEGGTYLATGLFYNLEYFGVPTTNLYVLDGGLSKWEKQGYPVTKDVPARAEPGTVTLTQRKEEVRVKLPEFLTASGDTTNNVLLETLDAKWHFGELHFFSRAGHIPNAIMLPSEDYFNADKTFKSAEEISRQLAYLGVKPEQHIYTHCGGGGAASVSFFALKHMLGYPKVKLYQESQMGWLADERELPYWTYDAPLLMRETYWLKTWVGRMIRTFLAPDISIVDVRPPEQFKLGHVPYAVNIPAEVFRNHLAQPDQLAELLGPSGVNASHEAVIVSGAGVTKESALAFVLLERLGQNKVSVFMDSMDTWVKRGFDLAQDATIVGVRKTPKDLVIPAASFPKNFRKDLMITEPKSTQGLYPKIFIASGKTVPAKPQDGKVIHVPYTDLINADGTPKAAKDIWTTLTTAGVPRYAELVFFSDDPGEAAVNYFVMKLMGFPDLKVLVI